MKTFLRQPRSIETQKVVPFTGEGAYHGSTKPRPRRAEPPAPLVDEMRPSSLERFAGRGAAKIAEFDARFPNLFETIRTLSVPSQDEIAQDGVSFCWCPLDTALREAGPLTRKVLEAMREQLEGSKRAVYVDAKIQYFEAGDVPVDSQLWHVDGSITARGPTVESLGHSVLHDMRARLESPATSPKYLVYQSSEHCATQYVAQPLTVRLPELIPNFDGLDQKVRALDPKYQRQPAAAIVRFDGLSLHRAVAAKSAGWRLWVRCVETDRHVQLNASIIECYGTVFRTVG